MIKDIARLARSGVMLRGNDAGHLHGSHTGMCPWSQKVPVELFLQGTDGQPIGVMIQRAAVHTIETGRASKAVRADLARMLDSFNTWSDQGWSLEGLVNEPGLIGCSSPGCNEGKQAGQYAGIFYQHPNVASVGRVRMEIVTVEGVDTFTLDSDGDYENTGRSLDFAPVDARLNETGGWQRLVGLVELESTHTSSQVTLQSDTAPCRASIALFVQNISGSTESSISSTETRLIVAQAPEQADTSTFQREVVMAAHRRGWWLIAATSTSSKESIERGSSILFVFSSNRDGGQSAPAGRAMRAHPLGVLAGDIQTAYPLDTPPHAPTAPIVPPPPKSMPESAFGTGM